MEEQAKPIARVCVMVSPMHLDRPFDYLVPADLEDQALPGCRVRIRFAGRAVDGFILSRAAHSDHVGKLAEIDKVVGPAVLSPAIARLARAVADRYLGSMADVLRDAVPRRHLRAERRIATEAATPNPAPASPTTPGAVEPTHFPWVRYEGACDAGRRLAEAGHQPVRAALVVATAHDPAAAISDAVVAAAPAGSCLVVAPDRLMVDRIADAIAARLGQAAVERLSADLGSEARYSAHLRIMAGRRQVVVGTRSAVFAPLDRLALVVLWDDGDDVLAERHHPGWNAREVLAMRAREHAASLLLAGFTRTVNAQRMVATGFLESWEPGRDAARTARPTVVAVGGHAEGHPDVRVRVPHAAFQAIAGGLAAGGPVLAQVARAGYVPGVACRDCHTPADCPSCGGPLSLSASRAPECIRCGTLSAGFVCRSCGGVAMRAMAIGSSRTAEELGRAFPGVKIITSSRDSGVREVVGDDPAIVVATVGAEPAAPGGYCAAVLLDGDRMLARTGLGVEEETLRRWFAATALVRESVRGGRVVVVADPAHRAVQALLRSDPVGWARRELTEREEAHLPPAATLLRVVGTPAAARDLVRGLDADGVTSVLGPVPINDPGTDGSPADEVRYQVLSPRRRQAAVAAEVRARLVAMSARSRERLPSVRVDPLSM